MRQLVIKVLNIIDARFNHEDHKRYSERPFVFYIRNIVDMTTTNLEASDLRQDVFKLDVSLTMHCR